MGISEQIRAVWALDPAAPAVEFGRAWTSWGRLRTDAEALEALLEEAGVPSGGSVGLVLRNDPGLVTALLGTIASGRCAATLSPHQGDTRIAADVLEVGAPALVATAADWERPGLEEACRRSGAVGIAWSDAGFSVRVPGDAPPDATRHEGVAVLMLTSGTTGTPKRVPLRRAALERSLLGAKHYEKDASSAPRLRRGVAVINAPLVHVSGIFRVLQCACDGRSFALMDRFRPHGWLELVKRHQPRTASLVPTAVRMVLAEGFDPGDLASLKTVICGTAPLEPEIAQAFEARYGIPVLTTYGATEFAGGVAGWNLEDHEAWGAAKLGSVGRAHPGCELRIVDEGSGEVLPADEHGLLEVRSSQLGEDEAKAWVRTTDLASLDEDGFLWIHGRADAAILRGGFKVHPAEVAAVLEEHDAVLEAAVVGLDEARLGQVPVAAVETRPDATTTDAELLDFARERLAGYQVPVEIRITKALPRTASLKVSQPEVRALFAARD